MTDIKIKHFPETRLATIDVCAIGLRKHHIAALIEVDVSESREKIKLYRRDHDRISFTAWLIKVISSTVKDYNDVASYRQGKRKLIVFNDINVSIAVEKEVNGQKVPIPLVIEKASERSIGSITQQINDALDQKLTEKDIVLQSKSSRLERLYYLLPGFTRRLFWQYLVRHPHLAFRKMGNVAITTVGMLGRVNGWFIPISVHPICFGIGGISKKPVVVHDKIEIREVLNITVLIDHDVVDGGLMARFISNLSDNIEKGKEL
jgi:pyruvate/2-oxoglutarate dehydrogenase complex dihydrolipoamide acyltransferase (E2) component